MSKISGRITVKETGAGVPDLVVAVYAGAGGADGRLATAALDVAFWSKIKSERMGSAVTGEDGRFELETPAAPAPGARAAAVRRAALAAEGLLLVVSAPEENDQPAAPLHVSWERRTRAGAAESFAVRISAERLKKAGISRPSSADPRDAEALLKSLETTEALTEKLRPGFATIVQARAERGRADQQKFDKDFRPALEASLSSVPEALKDSAGFVAPGDGPAAKGLGLIKKNVEEVVNRPDRRAPVRGVALLSAAEWDRVKGFDDGTGRLQNVPPTAVIDEKGTTLAQRLAGRPADGPAPATIFREDPLEQLCRPKSEDTVCAEEHLGLEEGPHEEDGSEEPSDPPPVVPGTGVEPAETEDIPRFIARVMDPMAPPEGPLSVGGGGRATQNEVENAVGAFQLRPGPADQPAFHSFHQLQIAFEPVWQEVGDQGLLDLAGKAYQQLVLQGGAPTARATGAAPSGQTSVASVVHPYRPRGTRRHDMRSFTPGFANALVVMVAVASLAACNDDVVGPENRTPRAPPSATWLATATAHDDFDAAVIITALPFTDSTNTSEASTAADDPDCFGQGPTVWYAFTAPVDGLYEANTFGSDYDTSLGAYTGMRGSLTELACNDDAMSLQSQVQIQIAAGETVYFMVGAFASGPGGNLVFNLDVAPPPPPPFTVEFTVDQFGGIDASTGVAFVRGTSTCSLWSYFSFYGVLRQRIGRLIVEAPFYGYGECNGTTPWEVEVRAQNALLVGGRAEVIVEAYFYDLVWGQSAFAYQNVTVVLRGGEGTQSASATLGGANRPTLESIRSLDDVIRHDSRLKQAARVP